MISFDKMTLNSSSKFGFSLQELQEIANQPEISKPIKRGREAFKERLKHDDEIQTLKKLKKKKEVNQSYTKIIKSKSNIRS